LFKGSYAAGSVPKVLHTDYSNHVYIMEYIENTETWKDMMMSGDFDESVAANVVNILQQLHSCSNNIDAVTRAEFEDLPRYCYCVGCGIFPFL
jgi:aminoglycoside phosphotransferase (APT) family kinase protein